MKNLDYLMDHILYQIFNTLLIISSKTVTYNAPIRIYVNKIEKMITFTIKAGHYLQLLMLEMMKLLGSAESKITKGENGENMPRLEITKAVLVHCNIVKIDYQQDSRVLYTFVPNKSFGQLLHISSEKSF